MKPNILFIVIDAFPYERCQGKNKTSKTPNLDFLIKKGVSFEQAISVADATPASFGSMFTGLFPFKCAVRGGLWLYKLKPNVNNYIKILKNYGYHAYATAPKLTSMKDIFSDFENEDYSVYGYRLPNGLGNKILKRFEEKNMMEPWIYLLHLMDAHKPISYPSEFDHDEYGKDEYDKMISSLDIWIGKIIKKIDLEKTIIVITADHGDYIRTIRNHDKVISLENKFLAGPAQKISKFTPDLLYSLKIKIFLSVRSLIAKIKLLRLGRKLTPFEIRNLKYARSKPNHFLFDELVRVPLIMVDKNIPSNISIRQQIRTVDIFPTLLEVIGFTNFNKNVDGVSFLPLLKRKKQPELPAYIETSINYKDSSEGGYGIRTSKYKYFRRVPEQNKQIHLYDLELDPLEEENIAQKHPEIIEKMEKIISELKNVKKNVAENHEEIIISE